MSSDDALVVMLKAPVAGAVKTRLVPPLDYEEAAGLYRAFILDIFTELSLLEGVKLFAAFSPPGFAPNVRKLVGPGVVILPQRGEDLGDRLYNVFETIFTRGFKRVAVIGSDCPDLPAKRIKNAFSMLREDDAKVVLGPAIDGGYYLIAMDALDKRPFEGISWSTELVLDETLERLGGDASLLKAHRDIDRPQDLASLAGSTRATKSGLYIKEKGLIKRCAEFSRRPVRKSV